MQRCMLVSVAPWCPQCRRAHGMILESVERLKAEGIEISVAKDGSTSWRRA